MARVTPAPSALKAAGGSDPGLLRDVNEDRYHIDLARGIFIVVDGVGGQAAGGKAADTAMSMLKSGLERKTSALATRLRESITAANNEIHRLAAVRPEWSGMACVLTAVVVEDGRAVVGHVGDTRLYKVRGGRVLKITRDHSPVGEREDQGEISESAAMAHPRRHEVYRDVGSDRHLATDEEFVDVYEVPFEPDAALLLCSDGLTDLVSSSELNRIVSEHAGQPRTIVEHLIEAANDAGGKDNVTVVYVEGPQFADRSIATAREVVEPEDVSEITRRRPGAQVTPRGPQSGHDQAAGGRGARAGLAIAVVLTGLVVAGLVVTYPYWLVHIRGAVDLPPSSSPTIVVHPSESIAAALARAEPGSQVIVEPGEYRERLALKSGVVVLSRVPLGATLRLPGAARDTDAAVEASGAFGAFLIGFRVVGDAATPLGIGVLASDSHVSVVDVEISGAADAAVAVRSRSRLNLVGSTIRGNPGAALSVSTGSIARVRHNMFAENGTSERVGAPLQVDAGADAQFSGNIFRGPHGNMFTTLSDPLRAQLVQHNVFVDAPDPRNGPAAPRGGRGR